MVNIGLSSWLPPCDGDFDCLANNLVGPMENCQIYTDCWFDMHVHHVCLNLVLNLIAEFVLKAYCMLHSFLKLTACCILLVLIRYSL